MRAWCGRERIAEARSSPSAAGLFHRAIAHSLAGKFFTPEEAAEVQRAAENAYGSTTGGAAVAYTAAATDTAVSDTVLSWPKYGAAAMANKCSRGGPA